MADYAQTASAHLDAWDKLLDAYDQIGESLPLLSEYEAIFQDSPHMLHALELMYVDILNFHQQALRFFNGKRMFNSPSYVALLSKLRRMA